MNSKKSESRFRLSGALAGAVVGAAIAMVQIVLFMTGSATYDVSNVTTAAVLTPGNNDFTGFFLIPVLLIGGFAAAGALIADRAAKPRSGNANPYA